MKKTVPPYLIVENVDFQIAPVKIVSDGDGHDYLIPKNLERIFDFELDMAEETEEYDDFIQLFDQFRIEGEDLELYIKL
jgi:hypothetical protein